MSRRHVAIAVACAGLLSPATATASNAHVSSETLFFFAAAGETNNLTIDRSGSEFVVTDPGAAIAPGAGCAVVNANQVRCAVAGVTRIEVNLDDLNDQGTIGSGVTPMGEEFIDDVQMFGEGGADVLRGAPNAVNALFGGFGFGTPEPSADVLTGGSLKDSLNGDGGPDALVGADGNDSLRGHLGNDALDGGPGFDSFQSEAVPDGADTFRGGGDRDRLGYSRSAGVRVSLDDLPGDGQGCPGAACENDDVGADIEGIQTGPGADTVLGSSAANSVFSDAGADVIDGGGGSDFLSSDSGEDSIMGGTGDDSLSGGPDRDILRGASGDDTIFGAISTGGASRGGSGGVAGEDGDDIFGGTGIDLADYLGDIAAVRVSLDNRRNDGVAGENDNLHRDVEDVRGTTGADVLVGSKFSNELDGGDGRDRIRGRGGLDGLIGGRGADLLVGGGGADAFDAGPAPDRLLARGGGADDLSCGSSVDRGTADLRDRLAGDCDRIKRRRGRR